MGASSKLLTTHDIERVRLRETRGQRLDQRAFARADGMSERKTRLGGVIRIAALHLPLPLQPSKMDLIGRKVECRQFGTDAPA